MTGAQIIVDVRGITKDPAPGTRWTDAQIMGFIADGVRLIETKYPECRLTTAGALRAVLAGTPATSATLPLDDMYYAPLLAYACARCFETTAGNERDQKQAELHRGLMAAFFQPAGD
jgi:hypothetical protein